MNSFKERNPPKWGTVALGMACTLSIWVTFSMQMSVRKCIDFLQVSRFNVFRGPTYSYFNIVMWFSLGLYLLYTPCLLVLGGYSCETAILCPRVLRKFFFFSLWRVMSFPLFFSLRVSHVIEAIIEAWGGRIFSSVKKRYTPYWNNQWR